MPNFSSLFRDFDLHMENLLNNITINTKYGAMAAATVTPIVVFGSIYIAYAYTSRAWKRRPAVSKVSGVLTRSVSVGVLHGGKMALERLVDYHHARADATLLEDALDNLNKLIQKEHPPFKELQRVVAKLEMSGKEDDAVEKLESALKIAQKEKKPHEAYEFQMLLIEMYIYKGDFVKALDCKCLNQEKISDARRPLYKAIVHGMLENHEKSRKYFEEFNEIRAGFEWPPGLQDHQLYEVIENFEKFQKVVQLLKKDIQETRKN
ncbi:hypothetical protein Dsin_019184 [Dipteronia sinensis]|uniref:Uncharacterized protein n=1 Tax=Dipteronia sinensis TaxID=43782 RepID=A0AAE0E2L5_9ROSI|nr:hypothetical protein Dsin_019184 [Dipteronia sinensis]